MGLIHPPAIVLAAEEPAWLYCNGGQSVSDGVNNYFIAWFDVPGLDGGSPQRFVMARLAFPMDVAKAVRTQADRTWEERAWLKGAH